jgi:hypothetical protein
MKWIAMSFDEAVKTYLADDAARAAKKITSQHEMGRKRAVAGNDGKNTEKFTYKYFILGHTVPVRVKYDALNRYTGAQIPDASEPSGFRWAHNYMTRLEKSEEVDEVDQGVFDEKVKTFLANRAAKKT